MTTPRPIAEKIADRFIGHQVNLLRLAASERRVILKMLNTLREELLGKLVASNVDDKSLLQERRILALSKTVAATIQTAYDNIAATHRDNLKDIAEVVSEQTAALTNAIIKVPLLTVGVPIETLRALVDDNIVMGAPAADWWARQAKDLQVRFQNTIRQGVYASESLSDLTRRVRGTRERRFQDGIMGLSTRNAEALIRTSVQSVANEARYETLKANDDVLAGEQVLTALDGRVCLLCAGRSGMAWSFTGEPLNEQTTENFPGPPPWHFNDRCVLVGVLKSWEQLAKDAKGDEQLARKLDRIEKKIDPGTQASMTGQISSDISYTDWLKGRSEVEQKKILGPGKFSLFRKGKIGLIDLVDQTGRPLSLAELRKKVA